MYRDVAIDWHNSVKVIPDRESLTKPDHELSVVVIVLESMSYRSSEPHESPAHKIRAVNTEMLRPCDRFKRHNNSYNVWVDISNWIILGRGYWSWDIGYTR